MKNDNFIIKALKPMFALLFFMLVSGTLCAQTKENAQTLHDMGRKYLEEGNIQEGRKYTGQAMEMRKKLFGEASREYIVSLNNYAQSFTMESNYDEAIRLQKKVLELCSKLGTSHPDLAMYNANLGRSYYLNGDTLNAIKYWEQALSLAEKYGKTYEYVLNSLGTVYSQTEDIKNIERIMTLMDDHNKHELKKDCNEPQCMLERALYYSYKGDNAKAKECYLQVLSMSMDDKMKLKVYESYANFLIDNNDMVGASEYYSAAAGLLISGGNDVNADNVTLIYKAGIYYFIGHQYDKAIGLYKKILDYYSKQSTAEARREEAECYYDMGNSYSGMRDYQKAKECFGKTVAYYEANDSDNEKYPKSLVKLANAEKFNKDYDISIDHYKKAMEIFDRKGDADNYNSAANSLKLCYFYAGKKDSVDTMSEKANAMRNEKLDRIINEEKSNLSLYRNSLGQLAYTDALAVIAGSYLLKKDYDSTMIYYQKYIQNIREVVRNEFRLQSESERMAFWQNELKNMMPIQDFLVSLQESGKIVPKELGSLLYDVELLSKGILLKSAVEFDKVLEYEGDEELKDIYMQTKANEKEIAGLRKSVPSQQVIDKIVSLTQKNQEMTLKLYRECSEFADFTDYISYDWKDVQSKMKDSDVAIEFAEINASVFDKENSMMAFVLTRDMAYPEIVRICSLEDVKTMETDVNLFASDKELVWGALARYLKDKHRIFFSADGGFNRVGIEYLSYEGRPLSEQFEVYRLSSTKELCMNRNVPELVSAVLFGDINYNDGSFPDAGAVATGSDDMNMFADLTGTKKEIDGISQILKSNHLGKIDVYTDTAASKLSFTRLSDTGVNLLHIATHGVYKDVNNISDAESMANSQLAFAGANLSNAGMVTAAEVATMNLRKCDLVVLSACETGLGKLGGDGVFGLQRGFKNSGVHTLLMSLKEVYDESTAQLMNSFYRNMINGMSKREALINAQRELRQNGYDDSKYWASFILLDAF